MTSRVRGRRTEDLRSEMASLDGQKERARPGIEVLERPHDPRLASRASSEKPQRSSAKPFACRRGRGLGDGSRVIRIALALDRRPRCASADGARRARLLLLGLDRGDLFGGRNDGFDDPAIRQRYLHRAAHVRRPRGNSWMFGSPTSMR